METLVASYLYFREYGAKEVILAQEGRGYTGVEQSTYRGA